METGEGHCKRGILLPRSKRTGGFRLENSGNSRKMDAGIRYPNPVTGFSVFGGKRSEPMYSKPPHIVFLLLNRTIFWDFPVGIHDFLADFYQKATETGHRNHWLEWWIYPNHLNRVYPNFYDVKELILENDLTSKILFKIFQKNFLLIFLKLINLTIHDSDNL